MRTVLATGSSTGIGRAAAVGQASNGWIVYAGVRRDQDARSVEAEHGDLGPYRTRVERALARQITKPGRHTNSPELVARVIHKALVAHRPKARYAVGLDAKLIITLKRLLPTSWLDKVIRHAAG
jgi:NAD(P)-dependent dehydrogenase (short-subunit alcohol dehydrogenase family)